MLTQKEALMPASPRSALLALAAALALCACKPDARAQPQAGGDPQTPPADASCKSASSAPDEGGRCAPRPQMCPMIYQPVCGADGRTYPNACHAARAGVSLAHGGACESASH
jgi:hypothetical protein